LRFAGQQWRQGQSRRSLRPQPAIDRGGRKRRCANRNGCAAQSRYHSAMTDAQHPWISSYLPGARWDATLDAFAVGDLLDIAAARFGDKPHLEFYGRDISYAETARLADRFALALAASGVAPGEVIALYCANSPFHLIALFGALKAGAVVTHLTPLDAERELAFKLRDTGARRMVTLGADPLLGRARKLLADGLLDQVMVGDDAIWTGAPTADLSGAGLVSLYALMTEAPDPTAQLPRPGPDDLALIQFTGGTTGVPKGAMLTHGNLTAAMSMFNAWMAAEAYWAPGETRHIGVLPAFHIYCLVAILLRATRCGDTILLRARFEPEQALADVEHGRANWFFAVPTMLIALAQDPAIERRDFSSLTFCVSGGAPLPVEVAERFKALTGNAVGVGWGMTETSGAGTMTQAGAPARPGSVGLPLPNVELEIVALDDPRRRLVPGEVGELRIRGPNVIKGYWNRPEETAAAFVDGWLLTGDIGFMDENGFFFLVDRKKDMIISSGFNVYPRAVEEAIYEHPDVEEVLVYGAPDAYRGEVARAAIRLRRGAAPFTLEALRGFLADKLGRHELPAAVEFHDALPRTSVGKLSKKELAAAAREETNSGEIHAQVS
jgi:long-chain acyl-CoA synthetase